MGQKGISGCLILLPGAVFQGGPIGDDEVLICADSGALSLQKGSTVPDIIIGDMDSIPWHVLDRMAGKGAAIVGYPEDKDASDGELAVRLGLEFAPSRMDIYGGKEGRSDHVLSSFQLLYIVPRSVKCVFHLDDDDIILLREGEERDIRTPRPIVSLIPAMGPCRVTLKGLKWELDREVLLPGSTRGIHNENPGRPFRLTVHQGGVFIIMTEDE